jgi:hypothetical protein
MSWDLGSDGGNSFPFDRIGDQVTGQIESLEELQQTDLQTGEPKVFASGQPMLMYKVTLLTPLRDPADPTDTGARAIYLRGSRKAESQSSLAAVLAAVKATTGGTALEPGGTLTLQYIGDGVATNRGFSAPKLYSATYLRPPVPPAPPAPVPAPAAPAYQPQAAPAAPAPVPAPAPVVAYQPSVPPAPPPAALPAPTPAVAAGPSPEQVAAVRAAGIDPASVWPGFNG